MMLANDATHVVWCNTFGKCVGSEVVEQNKEKILNLTRDTCHLSWSELRTFVG